MVGNIANHLQTVRWNEEKKNRIGGKFSKAYNIQVE